MTPCASCGAPVGYRTRRVPPLCRVCAARRGVAAWAAAALQPRARPGHDPAKGQAEVGQSEVRPSEPGEAEVEQADRDRGRALVIDDNPAVRQLVCEFLRIFGFDAQAAAGGNGVLG